MWSKIRWLVGAAITVAAMWWVFRLFLPESQSVVLETGDVAAGEVEREFEIISLLPKDAIPAIFDPYFMSADESDDWYRPDELEVGVEIDGEARAYSIPYLSRHEIVNDTVGGRKIAVTW